MIRMTLSAIALTALLTPPGNADPADRPYIFTQVHSGTEQVVDAGTPVQIQLPAGPARWEVAEATANVELTDQSRIASPGRIPGTDAIQVFDFRILSDGEVWILITSPNPPPALAEIVPDGRYLLRLDAAGR